MGVVYRARHVVLNKPVALKVLRKAQDEAAWKRFVQEAQSASMLNHSNVVAITDFGVIKGHAYLVMEFLEGQTLTEAINQGPIDPLRVCRIGAQIARGLQAVHDKGIVHRDLKPDNIFLLDREGKSDVVKIVDFGLAKIDAGERLTQDGTVVGTAEYISPEQVTGQDTDARSDQYSLGCILYEMLTSQLPFEGETTATLIYKHVYKSPTSPRKLRPEMNIPSSLEAVVSKCMAKKPGDRFPSMRELEQALTSEEQIITIRTSGGDTVHVLPRPFGSLDLRKWFAVGAAGSIVAILFGLLLFALLHKSPGDGDQVRPADLLPAQLAATPPTVPPTVPPIAPPGKNPIAAPRPPEGPAKLPPDAGSPTPVAIGPGTAPPPPTPEPPPDKNPGSDEPDEPEGRKHTSKPRSSGTVSVRFTVEPAAAPAQIDCKGRHAAPCKGSCQISIAEGATCVASARGFEERSVRWKDLKGSGRTRSYKIVLKPFKL